MDPLSDILSLLNPRGSVSAGFRAGGDWALRLPPPDGVKFYAVVEGGCWLAVEGQPPVRLRQGDCFLTSKPLPYTLASDLSVPPVEAHQVFARREDHTAVIGTGADLFMIGGRFGFDGEAALLLDSLPPVLVVGGESEEAAVLRWALQRLAAEMSGASPGSALVAGHLAHLMLVQVLRLHLASRDGHPPGWLSALSDGRVAAAIRAVHAEPARRWTVEELASVAGVSRSTFALRFKRKVGLAPLDYVLRWRMQIAARDLRSRGGPISSVAEALGYDSDSAFSAAFKRVMACSPRDYRLRHAPAA